MWHFQIKLSQNFGKGLFQILVHCTVRYIQPVGRTRLEVTPETVSQEVMINRRGDSRIDTSGLEV